MCKVASSSRRFLTYECVRASKSELNLDRISRSQNYLTFFVTKSKSRATKNVRNRKKVEEVLSPKNIATS